MLAVAALSILVSQGRPAPVLPIGGPALIVMLKDGCPCTRECRNSLNILADACRGKLKFAALIDANGRKARIVAQSAGLDFPVVADPKGVAIRSLNGKRALDLRLIDAAGKVRGRWEGFSRNNVRGVQEAIFQTLGTEAQIPLDTFTNLVKYGCGFSTLDTISLNSARKIA